MIAATAIHNALQQWVVHCTGFASDHVVWGRQNAPALSGSYIVLDLSMPPPIGSDWTMITANVATFPAKTGASVAGNITCAGHGFATGDGPVTIDAVTYWVRALDVDHIALASNHVQALTASDVTLTDGSYTIEASPDFVKQGADLTITARGVRTVVLDVTCFTASPLDTAGGVGVLSRLAGSQALPVASDILAAALLSPSDFGSISVVGPLINSIRIDPRAMTKITFNTVSEMSETLTGIDTVEISKG